MPDALLAVLILLPAVICFLLKSNASVAFLSLCSGFTLITLTGSDIEHLVGQTKITSLTSNNIDLALLMVPLFFTLIFTFHSVSGTSLRFLHIIPAICAGGLLAVLAGPIISDALSISLKNSQSWQYLQDAQSYIVGAGVLASLLLIWTGASHGHGHKDKKKHK